jgi:hypothetical protein
LFALPGCGATPGASGGTNPDVAIGLRATGCIMQAVAEGIAQHMAPLNVAQLAVNRCGVTLAQVASLISDWIANAQKMRFALDAGPVDTPDYQALHAVADAAAKAASQDGGTP